MMTVARTLKLILMTVTFFILVIGIVGLVFFSQIPSDQQIKGCLTTKMFKVDLCPTNGNYVRLSQISPYLQKAVVITEDSAFWQHHGFDFQELKNSLETNLETRKFKRGGSTITQQLAKNLFLTQEKTFGRKGLEALITLRMEKVLSKKEILEKYLNVVQFGKNLYGVKAASQFYFKKSAADLSAIEAAFLAMLLPSPEVYSKSFHRKQLTPFAAKRIRQILDRLYRFERINSAEYESSMGELAYFLSAEKPVLIEEVESLDEGNASVDEEWSTDEPPPPEE